MSFYRIEKVVTETPEKREKFEIIEDGKEVVFTDHVTPARTDTAFYVSCRVCGDRVFENIPDRTAEGAIETIQELENGERWKTTHKKHQACRDEAEQECERFRRGEAV